MREFHEQLSSAAEVHRRPGCAGVATLAGVPLWRGSRFRRHLLAGAAWLALATPRGAFAQSATVAETPSTGLGNVVAASSGATTWRFEPVSGGVSWQSGNGVRLSSGSLVVQVTINCTSAKSACASGNSLVKIQPSGVKTGRGGTLTRFAVNMGTAKLITGESLPTPASSISFTIQKIGNGGSATFSLGADFPIDGDDATTESSGAASSGVQVTVSAPNGSGAVLSTGTVTATVLRSPSMKVLNNSALNFGTIVRPSTGSNFISLPATTGTLGVTGVGNAVALHPGAATRVQLELGGEGHQNVSVSVPGTVILSSTVGTATSTLSMATSNTAQGTQQLSGSLGAAGTLDFYVGGAFTVSSTTPTGVYQGNIVITAQYN